MPIPPVEAHTEWFEAGRGRDRRRVPPAQRRDRRGGASRGARAARELAAAGATARRPRRLAPRLRRARAARAREHLRFDCFEEDPHYHYVLVARDAQRDAAPRSGRGRRPGRLGARAHPHAPAADARARRAPATLAARVDARALEALLPRVAEAAYRARYRRDDGARAARRARGLGVADRLERRRGRRCAPPRPSRGRRRRPLHRDGPGLQDVLPRLREGPRRRRSGRALRARGRDRLRRHGAAALEPRSSRAPSAGTWTTRPPWWSLPAANTLDRATAHLPRLLDERLDDLGIDFAVLYPSRGAHHALRSATPSCARSRAARSTRSTPRSTAPTPTA